MDNVKLDFIHEELTEWAIEVNSLVKDGFAKNKIGVTNDGYRSVAYQVFKATAGNDGRYNLSFHEYLRMVDMGTGKGGRGKRVETLEGNRKKWQGRKPKKFYSKTVYGKLNKLINSLIYNYQQTSVDTIKSALQ